MTVGADEHVSMIAICEKRVGTLFDMRFKGGPSMTTKNGSTLQFDLNSHKKKHSRSIYDYDATTRSRIYQLRHHQQLLHANTSYETNTSFIVFRCTPADLEESPRSWSRLLLPVLYT
jgi:hypothetical protein